MDARRQDFSPWDCNVDDDDEDVTGKRVPPNSRITQLNLSRQFPCSLSPHIAITAPRAHAPANLVHQHDSFSKKSGAQTTKLYVATRSAKFKLSRDDTGSSSSTVARVATRRGAP